MTKQRSTFFAAALLAAIVSGSATWAGGLANAIVETEQVMVPPAATAATAATAPSTGAPAWLLPALGVLVFGAIVAGMSDSDGPSSSDSPSGAPADPPAEPPIIDDVK